MKGVTMNNKITSLIIAAVMMLVSGCYGQNGSGDSSSQTESSADSVDSVSEAEIIDSLNNGIIIDEVSGNVYKDERNANPISPNIFCADPPQSNTTADCMYTARTTPSRRKTIPSMITTI